jgi:hypothetical protein
MESECSGCLKQPTIPSCLESFQISRPHNSMLFWTWNLILSSNLCQYLLGSEISMMQTLNEAESDLEVRYWIPYITKISPFYLHSPLINLDAITMITAISLKFVSNLLIIIPVFILWLSYFLFFPTDLPSYSHDFQFHFYVCFIRPISGLYHRALLLYHLNTPCLAQYTRTSLTM